MQMITINHADGRYRVLENGKQIMVPMTTDKILPVEFETREAAEGFVKAYKIITWKRARCPK